MAITIEYLWKDRKRYFGMPISFTRYSLSEDRLFLSVGFLSIRDDETSSSVFPSAWYSAHILSHF